MTSPASQPPDEPLWRKSARAASRAADEKAIDERSGTALYIDNMRLLGKSEAIKESKRFVSMIVIPAHAISRLGPIYLLSVISPRHVAECDPSISA